MATSSGSRSATASGCSTATASQAVFRALSRTGPTYWPMGCRKCSTSAARMRRRLGFRSLAGCDVGAFSVANIEFENVTSDIDTVFGANSPQHQEAATNRTKAIADFEGIAVHCAKGSPLCAKNSAPDILKDE